MFDNLLLIAIVTIVVWLATYGFYLYTSRQHQDLQHTLDELRQHLSETDPNKRA